MVVDKNYINVFQNRDALRSFAPLKPEIGVELTNIGRVRFFSQEKSGIPTLQRPSALSARISHQLCGGRPARSSRAVPNP